MNEIKCDKLDCLWNQDWCEGCGADITIITNGKCFSYIYQPYKPTVNI
jgi:hypothetical protein